ncbi:DsbA family protein [Paenibacillus sp. FSL R7-0204]|uniref:DsbA family protein n=1 Tax=Paenibacillus sp. FSL R7-0204 TaxID=2921675 RepID=UPI0030F8AA26
MNKINFRSKSLYATISIFSILVIFLVLIVVYNSNSPEISALEKMPNYTEIKGKYNAEGLKYEKQPRMGNANAKVKIIEFADFKCPACKKWKEANWDSLKKEFLDTGKAEIYFVNYAFIDRDSILAASAGEAIAKQNNEKFWEYYEKLYDHQGDETEIWATPGFLLDFVKNNIDGIDYKLFEEDFKGHKYMLDVKEDYKTAGHYGINGTPQFMVNGKLLPDASYQGLSSAIENELSSK